MSDSPSGHRVEISLLPRAFSGSADFVTISNLIIEKYASMAGGGAIDGGAGSNYWNVAGNELRFNHGMGIRSGDGMWIHSNKTHHNGQLGMGGGGTSIFVQGNEIYFNNYAGYSFYWEGGGMKFAYANNLTVQYNQSHDNSGPGFWTDINSQFIRIDSNQATRNKMAGILLELSYNATVSNNYIWNDAFNSAGSSLWWGAGILVSNSTDVEIYGNHVSNCMNGIGGVLANRGLNPVGLPYLIQNLNVHDNSITQNTGTAAGIVKSSVFDNSVYTSWSNHFQNNPFVLTNPGTYYYFYWLGATWTLATWNNNISLH